METTVNGLKKPECQDIEPIQINIDILDQHLSDTDIHVNIGKIADITEPDELTQIDSTDTNSTMWGKIKKSISEVTNHMDKVASETILGHIKIGTGLQMTDDVANVKIADDLTTDDATIALSASMGVKLKSDLDKTNTKLVQHIGEVASTNTLGHIKIGNGLQSSEDGTASVKAGTGLQTGEYGALNAKMANDLTTDDSSSSLSAAMGVELNKKISDTKDTLSSEIQNVKNQLPTRPLAAKGFVIDCLTETIDAGYYQYYATASNSPSRADGIIISAPWFEKPGDTWNNKFSFRLAIDTNGNLYTSVYKFGETWGAWNQK